MRLCRYEHKGRTELGFYDEKTIVPLPRAAEAYHHATHERLDLPDSGDLLDFLPPDGRGLAAAKKLAAWITRAEGRLPADLAVETSAVQLRVPIPRPNKLFLLAGNYVDHIKEGGGMATERAETFPYVFMKPPTTTLVDPGQPVVIPNLSPGAIDWELEQAVIIGRKVKGIREADALSAVAGYTVINDISNRKFRPNPERKKREKDQFFDWLHGKWFDSFCPCGPCVTSANAIPDPQSLSMQLKVNDQLMQDASTGQQIFPVAAVIEFIASFVTLEPGDIISTGTPAGVGNARGIYLKPGDVTHATIQHIGTLTSPVIAEA